ncbi:MAG: DUF4440 domain-containing protein [Sphingobacteriales bacterium]|nr:MAG: DUF4440 domain-containing protein [Sphingobacteriales bacterium]
MKTALLILLVHVVTVDLLRAQQAAPTERQRQQLSALISKYSRAREQRDTLLLKQILTADVDQLVSSGEWRTGLPSAVKGMQNSSSENPGSRTLTVDKIKMLSAQHAIVDCRYEIKNPDGSVRKMWSSFILVSDKETWKVTAIRNMLPSEQ